MDGGEEQLVGVVGYEGQAEVEPVQRLEEALRVNPCFRNRMRPLE